MDIFGLKWPFISERVQDIGRSYHASQSQVIPDRNMCHFRRPWVAIKARRDGLGFKVDLRKEKNLPLERLNSAWQPVWRRNVLAEVCRVSTQEAGPSDSKLSAYSFLEKLTTYERQLYVQDYCAQLLLFIRILLPQILASATICETAVLLIVLQQPRACCRQSHQKHRQVPRSGEAWD